MWEIALLGSLAFFAGFIDAVAGGGGLIQLPALFGFLPHSPPATVFGTNKLAAIAGTLNASVRYARSIRIRWSSALPAAAAAFLFSFLGAQLVSHVPVTVLRPVVLVLLVAVALYTFFNKSLGQVHAPRFQGRAEILVALLGGGLIGFYDGFFGPGTGSFLIFLFVRFFGYDFLQASACSKFVNVGTNAAALLYFVPAGHVLYAVAVPMALLNVAGSLAGSRMALTHGSRLIRIAFLTVLGLLIAKFAWDTFRLF